MEINNYKLSSYTIFIKLEDASYDYMLIHGYTGALDLASKELVTFLKSKPLQIGENCPFLSSIDRLIERGYITCKSILDERELVKRRADLFHRQIMLFKNFTILVTYDCNFRCSYCFENTISREGCSWSKKTMTKSMVDKLYETIFQIEPQTHFVRKQIVLYGGEPLLAKNKQIVKYIVNRGRRLGFSFKAITNGYELDSYIDLLRPGYIDVLQITLDGSEDTHNKRRFHYLYGNSFEMIMKNIQIALEQEIAVDIRINVDPNNIEELIKLQSIFRERGFFSYEKFRAASAQITGGVEEEQNGKLFDRLRYLKKTYSISNLQEPIIQSQDYGVTSSLYDAIFHNGQIHFRSIFCSAQSGGLIMDPYGNMYTCWECVGKDEYVVGNYESDLVWKNENLDKWYCRNIGALPKCSVCKYAFLCRGNCLGHILQNGGDFETSKCDNFSKVLEFIINKIYHAYIQYNKNK